MFKINWEKLKTFLIVLFAALNTFLIVFSAVQNSTYQSLNNQTVKETVQILKSKGILIEEDKILKKQINLNTIELKNASLSHSFTSDFKPLNETEFSVSLNGSIKNEGDVKKILSQIGIKENYKIVIEENKATVFLYIKKYPVFDVSVTLLQNKDNVDIQGSWYFSETNPKKSHDLTEASSLTGILIDFSNTINNQTEVAVENVEAGFFIPDSSRGIEKLKATATPCYKISVSDGSCYYFNAKNGEFLKKS